MGTKRTVSLESATVFSKQMVDALADWDKGQVGGRRWHLFCKKKEFSLILKQKEEIARVARDSDACPVTVVLSVSLFTRSLWSCVRGS